MRREFRLTSLRSLAPRVFSAVLVDAPPLLHLHGVVKEFAGVCANDSVDFDLAAGEIRRPARRERRRQDHADERPLRPPPPGRGRDRDRR